MGPIATRIRQLIDSADGGSVNAAARAIGLPQATLAQIVKERIKRPRAETLARIAARYNVSVDWILSGEGKAPATREIVVGEAIAWDRLVDSLQLSRPADWALSELPQAAEEGRFWLFNTDSGAGLAAAADPQLRDARRHLYAGWSAFVHVLVRHFGLHGARELLEREIAPLARGFLPTAEAVAGERGQDPAYVRRQLEAWVRRTDEVHAEIARLDAANANGGASSRKSGAASAKRAKRKR